MKKTSTIMFIMFCVFILVVNVYTIIHNTSKEVGNQPIIGENPNTGIGNSDKPIERTWEEDVSSKVYNLYLTVFDKDDDHGIKGNEEFKISLETLKNDYNVDFSSINTEYISCNLENSFIKIYYDDDILLTEIDIDCINSK